jgi:predicted ArsR family transcriptional regulator
VNFEDHFTGDYEPLSVPDLRDRLNHTIGREQEASEIREALLGWVRNQERPPNASDFKEQFGWEYSKSKRHREELVEAGQLEVRKESEGRGRPTERFVAPGSSH